MASQTDFLKLIFSYNEADLAKFVKMLKESDNAADELTKAMKKAGAETDDATKKMADGFDTVVKGVKAFLALELVKELGRITIEASKVAAAGEGIRSAFAAMGGSQADLKKLSDAIGGTIDNLKLMTFATKAMQKGLNMDQVTKTLIMLDKQANATGTSFDTLADKAIKGMTDIPTFMDDVIKKTKELEGTVSETGDAYGRLDAQQKNLQEAFGRLVNSSGFIQLKSFIAEELGELADFLNDPSGFNTKFAGKTIEELETEINASRARSAEIEKKYITENNAFRLSELRDELATEKQLRLDLIILQQKLDRDQKALDKKAIEEKAEKQKKAIDDLIAYAEKRNLEDFLAEIDRLEKEEAKKNEVRLKARQTLEEKLIQMELDFQAQVLLSVQKGSEERNEQAADDAEKKKQTRQTALNKLTGAAGGRINAAGTGLEKAQGTLNANFGKGTEKVKVDMQQAALAAFNMVDALSSIGDQSTTNGQKIFAGLQAILGALSFINPAFGVAAVGVGVLGRVVNKNTGGWIPGDGPDRDSVLAALTPGEFVTRRASAQRSPLLLDAINAGEIDDSFLKQLYAAPVVTVNQDQVVAAIERIPQTELYKSGSALYEARKTAGEQKANRKRRLYI